MNFQRKRTFQQDVNRCMLQDVYMCDSNVRVWLNIWEDVFILPMSINFILYRDCFIFKKETLEIIVKQ